MRTSDIYVCVSTLLLLQAALVVLGLRNKHAGLVCRTRGHAAPVRTQIQHGFPRSRGLEPTVHTSFVVAVVGGVVVVEPAVAANTTTQ